MRKILIVVLIAVGAFVFFNLKKDTRGAKDLTEKANDAISDNSGLTKINQSAKSNCEGVYEKFCRSLSPFVKREFFPDRNFIVLKFDVSDALNDPTLKEEGLTWEKLKSLNSSELRKNWIKIGVVFFKENMNLRELSGEYRLGVSFETLESDRKILQASFNFTEINSPELLKLISMDQKTLNNEIESRGEDIQKKLGLVLHMLRFKK